MKTTKYVLICAALGIGLSAMGCSSSSSCSDAGTCNEGGAGGASGLGGAGGTAPTVYALTPGTWCFSVLAISPGAVDDCMAGPDLVVGHALPVTYDMTAGTVEVGTDGSIGIGAISNNMATLMRQGTTADKDTPTCTWAQTDTSTLHMTNDNTFTVSVVENQGTFNTACTTAGITPVGGACTSTWMWSMMITGAVTPPACGN